MGIVLIAAGVLAILFGYALDKIYNKVIKNNEELVAIKNSFNELNKNIETLIKSVRKDNYPIEH